ncbi:MAG: FxsA family protein [Methylobacteriaceae bacterium]|nr:FxsA family protein [Methylobacteriaceae bacterium]
MRRSRGVFAALRARRPGPVAVALLIWVVAEVAAFWLVVDRVGFAGALTIGVATSIAGIVVLRHVGRGAIAGLRNAARGGAPQEGALLDGTLSAIAGVLLVLPGFVTDVIGLALAAPSLRGWIARRLAPTLAAGRSTPPGVVDLSPQDWRAGGPGEAGLLRGPGERAR